MRTSWILFVFPILLSLGLLMVILGQFQEMDRINKKGDELQELSKTAYNRLQYEANFKKALDDLLVKGEKSVKDLEAALVDFAPQLDSKKTESLSCQEQMKTKTQEVAAKEETQKKTTDELNAESEAWGKEIVTLKATLEGNSPICDYIKPDKKALELCGKQIKQPEENPVDEAAAPENHLSFDE